MSFESEVSGIQEMNLRIGKVALVRQRALRREHVVILSPNDHCRRLVLAEECLELRIEGRVGAIVVEQRQLDFPIPRPVEQGLIEGPGGRIEKGLVRNSCLLYTSRCV